MSDPTRIPLCGYREPHKPHPFSTHSEVYPDDCQGWPDPTGVRGEAAPRDTGTDGRQADAASKAGGLGADRPWQRPGVDGGGVPESLSDALLNLDRAAEYANKGDAAHAAVWIAEARAALVSPSTGDDRLREAAQEILDWYDEKFPMTALPPRIARLRAATPAPKPENPR